MSMEPTTRARVHQHELDRQVAAGWGSAWLLAVLVATASCGEVTLALGEDARTGAPMADADTGAPAADASTGALADAGAACVWTELGAPSRIFGIRGDDDWLGSVSEDGNTLIFDRYLDTKNDLFRATRSAADLPFGAAVPIAELNTPAIDATGALVSGGLEIYFASERTPTPSSGIWRAQRATPDGVFQAPVPVEELHAGGDAMEPSLTPDGRSIYFASSRAGGAGKYDIWFAERATRDQPFSSPRPLSELNTTSQELSPGISADGLELYFASDRPGGSGQLDIWRATRARVDEPFGPAENLVALNSAADDVYPRLSADGAILYYNHDTAVAGGRDADVWEARRQCIAR